MLKQLCSSVWLNLLSSPSLISLPPSKVLDIELSPKSAEFPVESWKLGSYAMGKLSVSVCHDKNEKEIKMLFVDKLT